MKYLSCLFVFSFSTMLALAQDSLRYRLIFIGENNDGRADEIWNSTTNHIIKDRTTLVFLDDNKFLSGELKPGSKDREHALDRLVTQFRSIRSKGADIYYINANEQWNNLTLGNNTDLGSAPVADSLARVSPGGRCPDPVEMDLLPQMSIIIFNSDWWLFPSEVTGEDCECKTRADVLARLDELRYKNKEKKMMIISRHPFQSYGVYGNKGTLKDHVFPLTSLNRHIYLPLPGVGSIFRFFRSGFVGPNNSKHPLYKEMVAGVNETMKGLPNLVHVSGHERGMQLTSDKYVQVVSGAGAKHRSASNGKYTKYADNRPGFVIADLYEDNSIRFSFLTYDDTTSESFRYTQSFQNIMPADTVAGYAIDGDSVDVRIHPSYDDVGKFHRFMFGENYRKEWAATIKLPVLRVSRLEGGLTPLKRGGGMQSKSLRLAAKDGK
ncbi:MAG TPA: hypothetical protein PLV32_09570 [Chitinophagaceae bacterium]|nr:hypothetical protein [Chitinophagaceae bacterium]